MGRARLHLAIIIFCAAALLAPLARAADKPDPNTFFEARIRPLLIEHCYKCHSAQAKKPKGGLLLDTRAGLLKGGDTGPAIVPGQPQKSLLIDAVRYTNADVQMPPKERLSERQIADLVEWIRTGAFDPRTDPSHATAAVADAAGAVPAPGSQFDLTAARRSWAFGPPRDHPVPRVKDAAWCKSPIDAFVLARLEAKGLRPAPPADRRTLIRRAYFDLIGLPPAPAEVEAFVNDSSSDAYAKVIDRLLARPEYGQRWARHWLDVVRYTDSFDQRGLGGEGDVTFAWRYRDWVVKSFNADLPYNQFVMDQIAGDLLPAKQPGAFNADGLVATGVYVMGNWPGGEADRRKMMTDMADDQVDLTSRAFLGVTIACARCHDHKFDPIFQSDYYAMAGIFFSTHFLPNPGSPASGVGMIRLPLASKAEVERRSAYQASVVQGQKNLDQFIDTQYAANARAAIGQSDRYLQAAWEFARPDEQPPGARSDATRAIAALAIASAAQSGAAKPSAATPLAARPVAAATSIPNTSAAPPARGNAAAPPAAAPPSLDAFAAQRGLDPYLLSRWIDYLKPAWRGRPARKLLSRATGGGRPGLGGWIGADGRPCPNIVGNTTTSPITVSTVTVPPLSLAMHPGPSTGVGVAWISPIDGIVRISGKVVDGDPNCGDGIDWRIEHCRGRSIDAIASGAFPNGGTQAFEAGNGGDALKAVDVRKGDALQIIIFPKANYACDTTVIDLDIVEAGDARHDWNLAREVVPDITSPAKSNPHADSQGHGGVWAFFEAGAEDDATPASALAAWAAGVMATHDPATVGKLSVTLRDELAAVGARPSAMTDRDAPARLYQDLTAPSGPFWAAARKALTHLPTASKARIDQMAGDLAVLKKNAPPPLEMGQGLIEGGIPGSEYAGTHDVHLMARGRYDRPGQIVPRGFPRVLAGDRPAHITQGSGRLELARWVASDDNPMTAKVMVNRIWEHHFGQGIVRTPNNFGKLGTPPTHPELLDYLARQFMAQGWSIKAMQRMIMLSATYQQSSETDPAIMRSDPDNLLLGRMNRQRLEAEPLRDTLLAVSGRLDVSPGGPAFRELSDPRRTLYLMTIRSDRSNYRMLFDAADPAGIVERRIDSTVAPQALFLMNDPFALRCARDLAARALKQPGDEAAKINWLYDLLYSRPASAPEVRIGLAMLGGGKPAPRASRENPTAADQAAWVQYCQVLLCTNEFIYVD